MKESIKLVIDYSTSTSNPNFFLKIHFFILYRTFVCSAIKILFLYCYSRFQSMQTFPNDTLDYLKDFENKAFLKAFSHCD